ncbi:MAG: hypothetical protein J6K89_05540 [Oscillospiraceae bacterium]|nr:hypothetical protein [Oscillospiraceae bacterium]
MKKKHIFLLLGLLILLVGLIIVLCITFIGLYSSSRQGAPEHIVTQPPDHELEQFLVEQWHFDHAAYLEDENTLIGYRAHDISYEQALKVGATVFTEDLAPESYLPQALTIAADVNAKFSTPDLKVSIVFLSSDDQVLFHADSDGTTGACWDTKD